MAVKKSRKTSKSRASKISISRPMARPHIARVLFDEDPGFFQAAAQRLLGISFLIAGVGLWIKGVPLLGTGFLLSAALVFFAGRLIEKMSPTFKYGLVILGCLFLVESLSVVPDYSPLLPQGLMFHFPSLTGVIFLLGCVLIFLGFRYFSYDRRTPAELKSWVGWVGLSLLLAYSVGTTCVNLNVPDGYQCDDADAAIEDVMDYRDLHASYLIEGYGFKEAGGARITAFLWNLIPSQSSLHMQFLGNEFFAFLNIIFVYLLGREMGGRRIGLIFAALMTFGKWVPSEVISGYFSVTATCLVSWCLFVFFRLLNRKTWLNFIHFGLVLALGAYMYPAFRLFSLFMIISSVIILILKDHEPRETFSGLAFAVSCVVGWVSWFLLKNKFLSPAPQYNSSLTALFFVFGLVVLGFGIKAFFEYRKAGHNEFLLKWGLSLFLTALLSYPMMNDPSYGARFSIINPLTHNSANFSAILSKIFFTFQAYFMGDGIFGTSGFDFQTACYVILGLVFFFSRPNWKTVFIFIVLWVGLIPHFVPDFTYNGRAAAAIPAFLLLSAFGIDQLRLMGLQIWEKKLWNRFFFLLLLAFLGWQAWTSYQSIYKNQIYHRGIEALVSREVIKDSPACRVYLTLLAYGSSPECQGVMDEGHPLYVFNAQNPIYLAPEEKLKDLVVIVFAGDLKLTAELKKEFPGAQWEGISFDTFHYPRVDASDQTIQFYRVFIPAAQITADSKKAFFIVPGGTGAWLRDFYWFSHRVGEGAIYGEDRANQLTAPFPVKAELKTARFRAPFYAGAEGNYKFSVQDPNFAVLEMDHRKVMDNRSSGMGAFSANRWVHLAAGEHQIDYSVYFIGSQAVPDIKVIAPDSGKTQGLDDFTSPK